MGVYTILMEIPKGWVRGDFCVLKMEIPGRLGSCMKSLLGGVMDTFWNYTMT